MKPWLRRAIAIAALSYPVVLVVVLLLFRRVGERWWVTGMALYLPRIGWGLPLPFLVALILWARRPRLLWAQVLAFGVLWFGLMGFVVNWPSSTGAGPTIRILSYNVNSGAAGADAIDAEIARFSPDFVALEEVLYTQDSPVVAALRRRYPIVTGSTQFIVASRFPIVETTYPPKLPYYGALRSPRWLRYVVAAPLGRVAIYVLHPISPRESFQQLRGDGFRHEIASGRLFHGTHGPEVQANNGLRRLQIATLAESALRDALPVIIAGDTNLPSSSEILGEQLGRFVDGFSAAGRGFGYTYPRKLPWMRLDRILANDRLRFIGFVVGASRASDHLCVVADVAAAR